MIIIVHPNLNIFLIQKWKRTLISNVSAATFPGNHEEELPLQYMFIDIYSMYFFSL